MNLIAEVLASLALRRARPVVEGVKRNSVAAVLLIVLFVTAYVALVVALALYVAETAGPVMAALTVALTAIALALVVIAVMMVLNHQARKEALMRQQMAAAAGDPLTTGLIAEVPLMMRESPIATTAMIGCLVYALAKVGGVGRKI